MFVQIFIFKINKLGPSSIAAGLRTLPKKNAPAQKKCIGGGFIWSSAGCLICFYLKFVPLRPDAGLDSIRVEFGRGPWPVTFKQLIGAHGILKSKKIGAEQANSKTASIDLTFLTFEISSIFTKPTTLPNPRNHALFHKNQCKSLISFGIFNR